MKAEADDAVRVIIVTGAGPAFSAGHDLGTPEARAERAEASKKMKPGVQGRMAREREIYLQPCLRWRNIPKPTIAQVQGYCLAGGLMLAWVCDLIIAADDAMFGDNVVSLGSSGVEYFRSEEHT